MSASDSMETNILKLVFQNAAFANIGDAGGLQPSSAAGNLYVSLHTGDPTDAGDQTSSECDYTSYARVAVARDDSHWTVTDDTADNTGAVTFPKCTGGTNTATHFGVGTASSGSGVLLFSGALASSLAISNNITPEIGAGDLDITAA